MTLNQKKAGLQSSQQNRPIGRVNANTRPRTPPKVGRSLLIDSPSHTAQV